MTKLILIPDVLSMIDAEVDLKFPLLIMPAEGRVSSLYGPRRDPMRGTVEFHDGIDFASVRGSEVVAAASGLVSFSGRMGTCGGTIVIDHGGGIETRYCHLHRLLVKSSGHVDRGEMIGRVGSSGRAAGPHLHFELRIDGAPRDPAAYLAY